MRFSVKAPTTVETIDDQRRRQLIELRQQRALELARDAGLTELARDQLGRIRFGHLEHDGVVYRIVRGEMYDPRWAKTAAYYLTADGSPVFLELAKR